MSEFWKYTTDTPCNLNGNPHRVRMEAGMTGIGSRAFWIDGKKQTNDCVTQTSNISDGPHFLYLIKWRDTPWDRVAIIVAESEVSWLMDEANAWREPRLLKI